MKIFAVSLGWNEKERCMCTACYCKTGPLGNLWAVTFKEESIWKMSEYLKNNTSEIIIQGQDGTLKSSSLWSYDSLCYYRR